MAGHERESERDYLLGLTKRLDELLAEVARINRRLRNVRNAIHALEDELTQLCEQATARAAALDD